MKKRTKKKAAKKKATKKKAAKKKAVRKRARKAARKAAPRRAAKKAPRKARKPKGPKGPKKPPKKKPPKKKPPKKKPPKVRPPKKAPPPPEPVLHEVVLQDPNGPDHVPSMSVSRGDQIRWFNETSVARMIDFTIWVFVEPETTIVVPAGGVSATYTLAPTTIYPRSFSYGVVPVFPGDSGPPDPPEVRADG